MQPPFGPPMRHYPSELVDLRSDTVTQPTPGMREAMSEAPVGDDVLGDDQTVIELQEMVANIFGGKSYGGTLFRKLQRRHFTEADIFENCNAGT